MTDNKTPYWKRKGFKSLESYKKSYNRQNKRVKADTGVYTLYMIYKKDLSEYYIGMTKKRLGYRKGRHFDKTTNVSSPFTGKSAKDYNHIVLHTTKTYKECNDLEREVIRTLTDDVRLLNKVYRG